MQFCCLNKPSPQYKKPGLEKTAELPESKQFAHSDWWKMQPVVLHASFSNEQ